jgi:hypothetical protein
MERNFTRPIVTRRLQSLLCCVARASFRLKSVAVVDAKQVLTGPNEAGQAIFTGISNCGLPLRE